MSTQQDAFDTASALLRKAALEIKQGHTLIGTDQWDHSTDAKAAHDSYMAAAAGLDGAVHYVEEMLDRIEGKVDGLLTGGNRLPVASRQWTVEDARAFATTWTEPAPPTPEMRFAWFMLEAKERTGRVYVAGPMTGLPDLNFPAFHAAAAQLRAQDLHVENPAEHGEIEGAEWGDYLRYDIGRLATCSAIYLLPGWENSKGAQLEVHIARTLDMAVMYAPGAMSLLQAELRQRPAPVVAQAPAVPAVPDDPMDWKLPCAVTVGHGTIGKGVPLRTLVTRMKVLYEMATGKNADEVANRTPEQRAALFDAFRAQQAAPQFDAAPAHKALEPVLYVSASQLSELTDPEGKTSGRYLPVRKTSAGNFKQALYTAPQPEAAPTATEPTTEETTRAINVLIRAGLLRSVPAPADPTCSAEETRP